MKQQSYDLLKSSSENKEFLKLLRDSEGEVLDIRESPNPDRIIVDIQIPCLTWISSFDHLVL